MLTLSNRFSSYSQRNRGHGLELMAYPAQHMAAQRLAITSVFSSAPGGKNGSEASPTNWGRANPANTAPARNGNSYMAPRAIMPCNRSRQHIRAKTSSSGRIMLRGQPGAGKKVLRPDAGRRRPG